MVNSQVGIRREDKNIWERRVPITPEHVTQLGQEARLSFCLQPSDIRVFSEEAYQAAGATIQEDLAACPVVLAVKEIPAELFRPHHTYVFFAHVVKGQAHNMPMLQQLMDLNCNLIDYEKITDDKGRRLIFFGRHAGLAGMVDTLWALGKRLAWDKMETPFTDIQQAYHYPDVAAAKDAVRRVGERIATDGLPKALAPMVCGFAGYGNVGMGAQELYDVLPVVELSPEELLDLKTYDRHVVYKVVFREVHTVRPKSPDQPFQLAHFFAHPEAYQSQFEQYLPHLTVLVNAIYWTPASPRLVTKGYLRESYGQDQAPKLKVIGDISCDVEGGIEATVRSTEPDDPIYVYDPLTGEAHSGWAGRGPVIMAVDNLPCELPAEASADFSAALYRFVPAIAQADYGVPLEECALPPEIKRAVIVYQGKLTPAYAYLEQHLP